VHEDILQTLVESHYADGRALTEDEITGLILTIMFAGHHTSGVTFSWIAVLLGQNPHLARRLVEEQQQILGDRTTLTYDDLKQMKLLEWTIKEALRLYPPIILVMRRVLKAFEFGGYNVPEGAMLLASPAVSGRIPDMFAEPHRCDPDRYGPAAKRTRSSPTATSPSAPAATAAWASCSRSCSSAPCGATSSATSNCRCSTPATPSTTPTSSPGPRRPAASATAGFANMGVDCTRDVDTRGVDCTSGACGTLCRRPPTASYAALSTQRDQDSLTKEEE
jgi:hypothetical protein